jgi:hypothetical protein
MIDARERMARVLCCPSGCCVGLAVGGQCEVGDTDLARAADALALSCKLIDEALPVQPPTRGIRAPYYVVANDCRAAALRALGGEP